MWFVKIAIERNQMDMAFAIQKSRYVPKVLLFYISFLVGELNSAKKSWYSKLIETPLSLHATIVELV